MVGACGMAEGFSLELQEYCSYCGEFSPDIEKIEATLLWESSCSYMTIIKCANAYKCSRIAENLKNKLNSK